MTVTTTCCCKRSMNISSFDSNRRFRFSWCDPIAEVDENGEHVLLHRQVTTEFQVVVV
jgi:hypothetical protein